MGTAHDVLVIGAGCAGMRAAIAAHDAGADVAVISKLHPTRSHSGAAEGGINAALGNAGPDSAETHAFDTVKGSDFLADQDAVEVFAREAPDDIYELDHWGAVFTRADDGRLAQRPFGAAGSPRTVFAADITGHVLIQVLYEQLVKRDIRVYEEFFAWKLIEDGGRCQGVIAWDLMHGGLHAISGRSTILATGGIGRIYRITTNAYASTGDGAAMALRLGLPLKDMEFMQFHPTTLYPTGILMTEGCRGEGAFLINKDGERFMQRYAPNALELASRDVVSRSEQTEIDEGRGVNGSVMLDMRHLGAAKIIERLPGSRELAITYAGVDPDLRPGAGAAGGPLPHGRRRRRTPRGPRSSPGLYAAGEVGVRLRARGQPSRRQLADGDDHLRPAGRARGGRRGAARRRTPRCRSRQSPTRSPSSTALLARTNGGGERPWKIREELGSSMLENFGVFRREGQMQEQVGIIDGLRERYESVVVEDKGDVFNTDLTQALELGGCLELVGVHDPRRARAQGEPRRALPAARLPRP